MTFEFGKYQSQVLISLKFLSKNKDNELSAEKSKSYKYLMDKSVAKELIMDIDYHNRFEKKDPIFVIENAGGYNYRGNEVAIESIDFFTEDKYFRTKCSNPTSLVYLTKAKTIAGNSPIKCEIRVDNLNEHELEIINSFYQKADLSTSTKISDSFSNLGSVTKKATQSFKDSSIALNNKPTWADNSGSLALGSCSMEPNSLNVNLDTCKSFTISFKNGDSIMTITPDSINISCENNNNNNERGNNMFKNVMKDFYCGPATDVKMSIYGPAFRAVSTSGDRANETYVAYHNSEYIDVLDGILDIGTCAYVMPIAAKAVKKGDFIKNCGTWLRVTSITNEVIEGENVYTRNIVKVRPTKNVFGFNFYLKLITFDIMGSTSEDNPFGNLLPLILLGNKDSKMNDMLPLMFMTKDFDMSNPMMMYLLANKNGSNNELMTIMMMSQFMNKKNEKEGE
jgi:hypothetical protein